VTEVDVESMEVVALCIDGRSIGVATSGGLGRDTVAELDGDLVLRVVVRC
jgi:hypothetical protein